MLQPDGTVFGSGNNHESCLTADGYSVNPGDCCADRDVNILVARQLVELGSGIVSAGVAGGQNRGWTML